MCVLSVRDESPELLQYASSIGISLNTRILVKQKLKFDGSIIVRIGSKETVVSSTLSENVFVEV